MSDEPTVEGIGDHQMGEESSSQDLATPITGGAGPNSPPNINATRDAQEPSNADVEGTPAGRADASDVRDDGPRDDGGDRRLGEGGGSDALGVGAPAAGVGADGPTARPVSQKRIDRIVGAARALLADPNNVDVRRDYMQAVFNIDRAAEVIVTLAGAIERLSIEWGKSLTELNAQRARAEAAERDRDAWRPGPLAEVHELKCWPEFFEPVDDGRKPWELRTNDRGYRVGDILHLREWRPHTERHTGRECWRGVTFILYGDGDWLPNGKCIMGLAPYSPALAVPSPADKGSSATSAFPEGGGDAG